MEFAPQSSSDSWRQRDVAWARPPEVFGLGVTIMWMVKTIELRGFTMIEMLMVILLVSILSLTVASQFIDMSPEAKTAVTRERMNTLKAAIVGDGRMVSNGKYTKQGYETHCVGLPSTLTDLITQPAAGTCSSVYDPFTKRGWRGPYVSSTDSNWNKDAWGTALVYYSAGPPARTLRSCGPNATCGNADDIDITF
jgi:prepilin-type N-terminal cleavage/methylation domain-containing protein